MAIVSPPVGNPGDLIADKGFLRADESRGTFDGANDDRLQLIERITQSEAFQKSSRLPVLLRYLAERTLANDRAGLTEQAIGQAVFGKPRDFHPTEDSSVPPWQMCGLHPPLLPWQALYEETSSYFPGSFRGCTTNRHASCKVSRGGCRKLVTSLGLASLPAMIQRPHRRKA